MYTTACRAALWVLLFPFCLSAQTKQIASDHFTLAYTAIDSAQAAALLPVLEGSCADVEHFFAHPFLKPFGVRMFSDRQALNRQWQQDWKDSTFQSQCWMVASGTALWLDLISPRAWATDACEHRAEDTSALRKLICHELVHVYHGQHNPRPDFTGMDDLAWWVEGLATFASGQMDGKRVEKVKKMIADHKAPDDLQQFWAGPNRYGLSGSMVALIEQQKGRSALYEMLRFETQEQVMPFLGTTEAGLLDMWRSQ